MRARWRTGQTVTLTFSEDLDATSVPGHRSFVVMDDPNRNGGVQRPIPNGVGIAGPVVTLTLGRAVLHGSDVLLGYGDADFPNEPLKDAAGNLVEVFSRLSITNETAAPPPSDSDPKPDPESKPDPDPRSDPDPNPRPPRPPEPEPEPPASDCTLTAPHWSGPTGGFTVRPAPGRTSVSLTCGARTTEYMAENGLVTRLVKSACRGTGLQLTGAAAGGWYWQHGDRNAAVAPLVCSEALGGPPAVVPGGVTADATDDGTLIRHDTARLIGIVPHFAGNDCGEYVTPHWQGDGGVVVRPAEGRETVRVRVQCGRTYSTMTPSAGEDGVIVELVRKSYCTDDEGNPKQGRLTVTGAAPGGWYWIDGEANAAVAPLMCADLMGGPEAVDPGGVVSRATEDGTYFKHDTSRLIGVVPHLAPNPEDD